MRFLFCLAVVAHITLSLPQTAVAQAGGDPDNGKDFYKVCRACHQVGPGAKNGIGPILNGIVGRKAGTIAGFTYSEANTGAGAKGVVWTEDNLKPGGVHARQQDGVCGRHACVGPAGSHRLS
jgi:cytochrome c